MFAAILRASSLLSNLAGAGYFSLLCCSGNSPRQAAWYNFSGAVMKKLTTWLIGVVGLIGTPAFAADMAVKAPPPRPAPAPVYSWTGWYVGAHIGYGWDREDPSVVICHCVVDPPIRG
jgi:hypothetical protein